MTKQTHTKEERSAYYKALREQWQNAAQYASAATNEDELMWSVFMEAHSTGIEYISKTSFLFVRLQMKELGLSGIPYLDCKTFEGWKRSGFQVKRGEKSALKGMTWIHAEKDKEASKDAESKERVYPKVYHLFHKSQVEAVA
jgi:hypothetical protein